MSLAVAAVGLVVGALVGLTGVGGGSLLTPVLVWLGTPVPAAVGTDLAANGAMKLVGAAVHHRQRTVAWPWARTLALGGVPGAVLGSWLLAGLKADPGWSPLLRHFLGAALVLATLASLAQGLVRRGRARPDEGQAAPARPGFAAFAAGAATGFLVGLTSVGAGSLVAPVLFLLSPLSPREVVGTDIASSLFVTTAAALAHASIGTVKWGLAANLLLGAVPGTWLGSRLALVVPRRPLRWAISGLILAAGLRWLT